MNARLDHLRNVEAAILNCLEVIDSDTIVPTDSSTYGAVSVLHSALIAAECSVRTARCMAEALLREEVQAEMARQERAFGKVRNGNG